MCYSIAGCSPAVSKQFHENPTAGISLEKPENWDLGFSERSAIITLVAERGLWNKDSTRIEIHGPACLHDPLDSNTPVDELLQNIDRIRLLHDLESVTIIQGPIEVEIGCNEVSKALIEIPTMSMSDDPNRIQVGNPRPDTFQPIEIYAIKDSNDRLIMVYLYQGDDEELNTQAEEIINSILISCSAE